MTGEPMTDTASFVGGLNTVADPSALSPVQARALTNARLTTYGAAVRRGGTRTVSSSAVSTGSTGNIGIYWPLKAQVCVLSGSPQNLFAAPSPSTFSTTWTLTFGAGATFKGTALAIFTDGTNEVLYGMSQANGFYKWTGTVASAITAGPPVACAGICVYNQRLWGWNSVASPNSVYYSALNLGDTYSVGASGGGQIVVTHYEGAAIQWCAAVGASLMIFHLRGISRLTGFGMSDLSVSPQAATNDIAICGVHAGAVFHNSAWVATQNGLYQVTEASAMPVGTPEAPDPTVTAIAASASPTSVVVVASRRTNEIWVQVPGTGVYAYHILLGAWTGPFDGTVFAAAAPSVPFEVTDSTVFSRLVVPPDTNGVVREADSPDWYTETCASNGTGGTNYTMTLQTRRMYGRIPFQDVPRTIGKVWTRADVEANLVTGSTAPTLTATTTLGGAQTVTLAAPLTNERAYYAGIGGAGQYVDVTIADSGSAASQYSAVFVYGTIVGPR